MTSQSSPASGQTPIGEVPQELIDQFSKLSLPSALSVGILPSAYGSTVWLRDGQKEWTDLFTKWTSLLESSSGKAEGTKSGLDAKDSHILVDLRTNDETHRIINTKDMQTETNEKGFLCEVFGHPGKLGEPVSAIPPQILDQFSTIKFVVPINLFKWSSKETLIMVLARFTFHRTQNGKDSLLTTEEVEWSAQSATKAKQTVPGKNYDEFTKQNFVNHQELIDLILEGRTKMHYSDLSLIFEIINDEFKKTVVDTTVENGGCMADLAQLREAILELPHFVNKRAKEIVPELFGRNEPGKQRPNWEVEDIKTSVMYEEKLRRHREYHEARKNERKGLAARYAAAKQ